MPAKTAIHSYSRLEHRLTLLSWLHGLLGYQDTKDLLGDIQQADEGFDGNGRSHVHARLAARAGQMRGVTVADLQRYDDNIRDHLAAMNAGRTEPITLRYFQYLTALYTEIFLDRYNQSPAQLLDSLNKHIDKLNLRLRGNERVDRYKQSDMKKLAFWMATGSGKTLLMHLNYRQYLHYNREPLDNVLLITPSEDLSQQHLDEMMASGIPARRFDMDESALFGAAANTVQVIEITKLVTEKRGQGVSVPIEVFEGRNLVFVDEGHKGSGSEAQVWRSRREELSKTGFTFEYSATFGQALTAARDDALTAEYGKAIAFDYSYRYFHDDGFGKDFHVLNLPQETTEDRTDTLLLANMLSFYEQQRVFADQAKDLRPYNLEQPLWLFLGSSVTTLRSDVLTVARFLHKTLSEPTWATETIAHLLKGKSDLTDERGDDLFANKYPYLRNGSNASAEAVYQGMLERTLHAPSGGGLHIANMRGSNGELGLKASASEHYFGLIYIGDTAKFKSLVTEDSGITLEDDAISGSLFDRIAQPGTTIETLIGSRKFIEGWNSWRVSNMGLLNIGKNEGSQIIQLFGRGVRLRGRDMTLKRSSALNDGHPHPEHIGLLETLNIFSVRANYMAQFRDYLKREGVPMEDLQELPLFIRPNQGFLNKGLVIPRVDEERDFKAETEVLLEYDDSVPTVSIDVSTRVQSLASAQSGIAGATATSGKETVIPPEGLDKVDWDRVYLSLIEHKERNGIGNLAVFPGALRPIMEAAPRVYSLVADPSLTNPTRAEQWEHLQETVTAILRLYADKLYRRSRECWESSHMVYKPLDDTDANFSFNTIGDGGRGRYVVGVPKTEQELIEEIKKLIDECRALYESESNSLPRIHFDQHLYQPLLLESQALNISPPGLKESERTFVKDLKNYWNENTEGYKDGAELFLLRNQGRGAGVGFFEESRFYPDFILWIKTGDSQRIVFVEPHGMVHAKAYAHDDKARLHEELPELARAISQRLGTSNVTLDSFIVSATSYDDLHERYDDGSWDRERFASKHILFPERNSAYDYVAEIVEGCATSVATD